MARIFAQKRARIRTKKKVPRALPVTESDLARLRALDTPELQRIVSGLRGESFPIRFAAQGILNERKEERGTPPGLVPKAWDWATSAIFRV